MTPSQITAAEKVVRPKRLVWDENDQARTPIGIYGVSESFIGVWRPWMRFWMGAVCDSKEAAQSACQRHYDETIWAGMEFQQQPDGKGEG